MGEAEPPFQLLAFSAIAGVTTGHGDISQNNYYCAIVLRGAEIRNGAMDGPPLPTKPPTTTVRAPLDCGNVKLNNSDNECIRMKV